ncbi:MAG: hypothetical protein ABGX07_16470 [Pirellulaceae bacterium]
MKFLLQSPLIIGRSDSHDEGVYCELEKGDSSMLRLCCFALLFVVVGTAVAADSAAVDLRYRSYRNWTINLPSSDWFELNDGIRLRHANGDRFAVAIEGNSLRFDTDGDGTLDRTIKPLVDPDTKVSTSRVILSAITAEGKEFRYAVRLRKDAAGWEWAPGGAMIGNIQTAAGPIPVRIIDQNGNGLFDDFGIDAMIVGSSNEAMFLSKTIVVDNQLQEVTVTPDGSRITLAKYSGATAKFDMTTSFDAKAVLLSTIVRSSDGRNSFDFGAVDGPLEVPVGTYEVVTGAVGLGSHRVQIGAGQMKPFKLDADQVQTFDWGGPVHSEFKFARQGGQVQFSPQMIWYFGKAGEEYFNWTPIGKSPQFTVRNATTGALLQVAILPGSC